MNGPTMRRRANGSTRPTSNPPRSRRRCSMTSSIMLGPSEKPLNRKHGKKPDTRPLPEARAWLDVDPQDLLSTALEPVQFTRLRETHFIGICRYRAVECGCDLARHGRAVDDKAEFGVEVRRARVEIEGPDEDAQA